MRHINIVACLFLICILSAPSVFAQTGRKLAIKLRGNVVGLRASFEEQDPQNGFGFVIGEKNDTLYFATAQHVVVDRKSVENRLPNELKVSFYQREAIVSGKVSRYDFYKDVAIISVAKPDGYKWRKNSIDRRPSEGGKAYYIGKLDEWTVGTEAMVGGIKKIDYSENTIIAENFNIALGSSGGPLLSENGIIGVITNHDYQGEALAVGLKTIESVATVDGRYPYVYSLPKSKLSAKILMGSVGAIGAAGVILGVQQMNDAKTSEGYNYYKSYKNPLSTIDYPPGDPTREDLYDDANQKYKTGQVLVIGGGIALVGSATWFLLKERVIKPKSKTFSKLSLTPQVYSANAPDGFGAKGIHVSYDF